MLLIIFYIFKVFVQSVFSSSVWFSINKSILYKFLTFCPSGTNLIFRLYFWSRSYTTLCSIPHLHSWVALIAPGSSGIPPFYSQHPSPLEQISASFDQIDIWTAFLFSIGNIQVVPPLRLYLFSASSSTSRFNSSATASSPKGIRN